MSDNQNTQIKSTFKHAFIFSISSILQKAVGFIMLPIYASYLGTEGYGLIGVIQIILSVMGITTGQGIASAMQRHFFERDDTSAQNRLVSTSLMVTFVIVLITCLPFLIFNQLVAKIAFNNIDYGYFVILAVFTFMGDISAVVGEQYYLIKQRTVFVAAISIVKLLLGLFLNIYLIVYLQLGVLGVLYSNLICAAFFSLTYYFLVFREVRFKFGRVDAKQLLSFSLPLIPGYFFMFVRNNVDKVMITNFLGLSLLGVYTMLFQFVLLIDIFIIGPLLRIWSVKRLEICEEEDGPRIIAQAYTQQLALLLFAATLLSLEIPLVIQVLTPKDFWVPMHFVIIALAARLFNFSYYHFFFGLIYQKLTHKISIIQGAVAVTNIVLTFFLVKHFDIIGALISMLLVYFIQCLIAFFLSHRYYNIPFEWRKIVGLISLTGLLIYCVNYLCEINAHYFEYCYQTFLSLLSGNEQIYEFLHAKFGQYFDKIPIIIEACHKLAVIVVYPALLIVCRILKLQTAIAPLKKVITIR